MLFRRSCILLVCCLLVGIFVSPVSGAEREIRLGLVSDRPVERVKEYMTLVKYVADRLKDHGIDGWKVVVEKKLDDMNGRIRRGDVDFVFESACSTVEMMDRAGMVPELLVWRGGAREDRTLFFVLKDSPIRYLGDLRGKTIAFENAKSTSSYAVPKAELRKAGLTVVPAERTGSANAVRYAFAGSGANLPYWVFDGRADAGAFSTIDWDDMPEAIKSHMRVIHETKPVMRYVASFHPALPGNLKEAIIDILVRMDGDAEGRQALLEAYKIRKMERLTESDRQSIASVRGLRKFVDE